MADDPQSPDNIEPESTGDTPDPAPAPSDSEPVPDQAPANAEPAEAESAASEAEADGEPETVVDAEGPDAEAAAALAGVKAALAAMNDDAADTGEAPPSANGDSSAQAAGPAAAPGTPFDLPDFSKTANPASSSQMELLGDVNLDVTIELGRTRMLVQDILRLASGSVVELEKLAGDPVDIFVNNRHVARGEVLVLNDNFCVRISEVISQDLDDDAPATSATAKAVAAPENAEKSAEAAAENAA